MGGSGWHGASRQIEAVEVGIWLIDEQRDWHIGDTRRSAYHKDFAARVAPVGARQPRIIAGLDHINPHIGAQTLSVAQVLQSHPLLPMGDDHGVGWEDLVDGRSKLAVERQVLFGRDRVAQIAPR